MGEWGGGWEGRWGRFSAVMANLFLGKIGTFGRNFMSILGMSFRHIFLQFQILSLFIQSFGQESEVEGRILTNKDIQLTSDQHSPGKDKAGQSACSG